MDILVNLYIAVYSDDTLCWLIWIEPLFMKNGKSEFIINSVYWYIITQIIADLVLAFTF